MILDVLEHLRFELPLCVVGLFAELVPMFCSGHQLRLRLEGTRATDQVGAPASLHPLVSVTPVFGQILWPPHL